MDDGDEGNDEDDLDDEDDHQDDDNDEEEEDKDDDHHVADEGDDTKFHTPFLPGPNRYPDSFTVWPLPSQPVQESIEEGILAPSTAKRRENLRWEYPAFVIHNIENLPCPTSGVHACGGGGGGATCATLIRR